MRLHQQHNRRGWIIALVLIAGVAGLNYASAVTPDVGQTEASVAQRDDSMPQVKPDAAVQQVAGASTTAPAGQVEVTAKPKAIAKAKAANKAGQVITTPVQVAVPLPAVIEPGVSPVPVTITVNLKTPFVYTLRPGETSPPLSHLMTDGKQYPWLAGKNTFWQNETPDPALPVWSTIAITKPTSPYIADRIPFTVTAAKDAKPGQYQAKIVVMLRDNVRLGIPIAVTVVP